MDQRYLRRISTFVTYEKVSWFSKIVYYLYWLVSIWGHHWNLMGQNSASMQTMKQWKKLLVLEYISLCIMIVVIYCYLKRDNKLFKYHLYNWVLFWNKCFSFYSAAPSKRGTLKLLSLIVAAFAYNKKQHSKKIAMMLWR